jgi:two-component system, LuxR family, sensor kinase FixL
MQELIAAILRKFFLFVRWFERHILRYSRNTWTWVLGPLYARGWVMFHPDMLSLGALRLTSLVPHCKFDDGEYFSKGCVPAFAMSLGTTLIHLTGRTGRALAPGMSFLRPAVFAAAFAALIFAIDTFTPLDIAAAVMYVVVVLLSASFAERKGIMLWGLACVCLTLGSFLLAHVSDASRAIAGRTLVSVLAICTTTVLAVRMRSALDALRRSEAYLSDAQKLSQTGSFALNMINDQYTWSDETYRIFEYEKTVAPSVQLAATRIHPEDFDAWKSSLGRRRRDRENADLQYRLLFPGGRIKHIHSLAHPVERPGGDLEYIGALRDMTASKQAEDDLQKAQSALAHVTRVMTLGELMASIAHEVNQPLAGIVTNGEACLRWLGCDTPNLDEAQHAVARMIVDGRRAGDVIRRLRSLARRDGLQKVKLNLNEVIRDAIPLVRRELINRRIVLELDLARGLPAIMGDRVQLQQVLINLIINSIQAMSEIPCGSRKLSIRSRPHEGNGVLVTVADTGTGIEPENLDRLFNTFFTTKREGIGMGLSISRSIIEAHGGRIWASNNSEAGATVGFVVKQEKEAAEHDLASS